MICHQDFKQSLIPAYFLAWYNQAQQWIGVICIVGAMGGSSSFLFEEMLDILSLDWLQMVSLNIEVKSRSETYF